jgi:hypothetical protein
VTCVVVMSSKSGNGAGAKPKSKAKAKTKTTKMKKKELKEADSHDGDDDDNKCKREIAARNELSAKRKRSDEHKSDAKAVTAYKTFHVLRVYYKRGDYQLDTYHSGDHYLPTHTGKTHVSY